MQYYKHPKFNNLVLLMMAFNHFLFTSLMNLATHLFFILSSLHKTTATNTILD